MGRILRIGIVTACAVCVLIEQNPERSKFTVFTRQFSLVSRKLFRTPSAERNWVATKTIRIKNHWEGARSALLGDWLITAIGRSKQSRDDRPRIESRFSLYKGQYCTLQYCWQTLWQRTPLTKNVKWYRYQEELHRRRLLKTKFRVPVSFVSERTGQAACWWCFSRFSCFVVSDFL